MKIRYEFVARSIAGEHFLVPIGEAARQFSGMFALNELGAFLWEAIPGAVDEAELVDRVLDEYEVDQATARQDVSEFLDNLRAMGILEP